MTLTGKKRCQRSTLLVATFMCGATGARPVVAQETPSRGATVRSLQAQDSEAPLPDVDAIERGADAPASVSFKRRQASAEAARANSAGNDTAAAIDGLRSSGGIYGLDHVPATGGGSDGARATSVPELHTVQKGDTLWSLCDFYFGDPWRWPKLWSQNPLVTNPHWIFPGDVVRLRGSDEPVAAPSLPDNGVKSARAFDGRGVDLREVGFIEAGALKSSAKISGSREEKIMLATGDQAYVSFPKEKPLQAGERYTVFMPDVDRPVRSPEGQVLGYLVRVYGDLLVDQVADDRSARGALVQVVDPIERGYWVSAHVQQFKRINPKPSDVNLEARVLASFSPVVMLSAENFVVLSRGSRDGVSVGNRSFVIRRGDGYRPSMLEKKDTFDLRFPKEVVGEMWVVDVQEKTSVAWIARTAKEIRVGEVTEMRKGY